MQLSVPLSQNVIKEIIERSDRIPLFLEEVCKATVENLMLLKAKKQTSVTQSSNEGVPSSLAGSLMERLDRLGSVKGVAQVAAAVGPSFSRGILEDILLLSHGELDGALDRLVRSEIIYARRVGSETAYVFKHALLRDAAYSVFYVVNVRNCMHALRSYLRKNIRKRPDANRSFSPITARKGAWRNGQLTTGRKPESVLAKGVPIQRPSAIFPMGSSCSRHCRRTKSTYKERLTCG